jgi:metal-responsive CopG/Arc/MetJ family transcriptional regulator
MYSLEQLEKQQIGLRLPQYLIDEIDEFTQQFSVNRTDIVIEALRAYIQEQKEKFLFEKELLSRVTDIKNKKVTALTRSEAFDGI